MLVFKYFTNDEFFSLDRNIVDTLSGVLKLRSIKLNQIKLKNRASASNDALRSRLQRPDV